MLSTGADQPSHTCDEQVRSEWLQQDAVTSGFQRVRHCFNLLRYDEHRRWSWKSLRLATEINSSAVSQLNLRDDNVYTIPSKKHSGRDRG